MYNVEGKTAVITGGASGIGLGMARSFAGAGMSLVLGDIESDRLDSVVEQFKADGHKAIGLKTDVSDETQVQALADAALAEFGSIHVVSNNAGVGVGGAVEKMGLNDWQWTFEVNLWGVIYGVRTFLPILKEQGEGHISATASMAGLVGGPMLGAYHVSKHGVVGLMDSLRIELKMAKSDVRASVLCPGPVDTNVAFSERNRPEHLPREKAGNKQKKFAGDLNNILAEGLPPEEVGELVLDAVREERFWILTHIDEHLPMLERRLAAIKRDHAHRLPPE